MFYPKVVIFRRPRIRLLIPPDKKNPRSSLYYVISKRGGKRLGMIMMAKEQADDYDEEAEFDVADELYDDSESKRENDHDDEFIFDEVKGSHGKKTVLSKLNQRVVGKHEMDDIFCDWS